MVPCPQLRKRSKGLVSRSQARRILSSRVILLLTALLIALMPLTEHLWTWDAFICSGHDLELSLAGVLVFSGLVALSAHWCILPMMLAQIVSHRIKRPPIPKLFQSEQARSLPDGATPCPVLPCLTPLRI